MLRQYIKTDITADFLKVKRQSAIKDLKREENSRRLKFMYSKTVKL